MLELPNFFSLNDFRKCSRFAFDMLHFHQDALIPLNPQIHDNQGIDSPEFTEYQNIAAKAGYPVLYFYMLTKEYERHDECLNEYENIIINCDGGASNIADFNIYNSQNRHIAPTAHTVGFYYLHELYSNVLDCCGVSDCFGDTENVVHADLIFQNISEIQSLSKPIMNNRYEKKRLLSRIEREYALVLGCYSNGKQKKEISSVTIRKVVAEADNLEDPLYSTSWLNTQKKNGKWPKETKGGGRRAYSWDFNILKPYLVKQFPQVNWEKI